MWKSADRRNNHISIEKIIKSYDKNWKSILEIQDLESGFLPHKTAVKTGKYLGKFINNLCNVEFGRNVIC